MFSLYVARRYLFSRKSHHTINIISAISVCGVALATTALVVAMSVFNGFQELVASFFTSFDPQLKVTLVEGKSIDANDPSLEALRQHPSVEITTDVYEDQALIIGNERQWPVTIKGVVDSTFAKQADLEKILYGDGEYLLQADVIQYGILGISLAQSLGLGTRFDIELPIHAPKRGERINTQNPEKSFNERTLRSPGVVFNVGRAEYDANYIITSIDFARELFDQPNKVTAVEVKLKSNTDLESAEKELRDLLGPRFRVQNRYEQQEDTFRIMRIEKFIVYIFLTFILLVASFNIIGSLSMLMVDKRADTATLRAMGASNRQIANIFILEGWLISGFGALAGILIGLGLCLAQQTFELVPLGQSESLFVRNSYPVSVHAADVAIIFVTVLIIGLITVWLPARKMTRNLLSQ